MFDLETSVRAWRDSLPDEFRSRGELLDELEQHLRDDFERRAAASGSPADAWAAAIGHLGSGEHLAGEFAKLDRHVWLPAWIAAASLLLVAGAVAFLATNIRRPLLSAHIVLVTIGYSAVFTTGFLAVVAVIARAIGSWNESKQASFRAAGRRLALLAVLTTFAAVALGTSWSSANLGRWWAWDPKEIGGACVLAWSAVLLQCFRSRASTPQSLTLLGVMGNIVVALSWFGPALLSPSHSYGYPPALYGGLLGGFLIAQILLVYLALLPAGTLRLRRLFGPAAHG